MTVTVSYPGVYIQEFAPAAPIQGVGTSTPAFVGVAASGTLRLPTMITSWDQFQSTFGKAPVPGFYLYYAVRGFFENQGQQCYVVRASNGEYGTLVVNTRTGALPLFTISAAQPGAIPITITIVDSPLILSANTSLFQPAGTTTAAVAVGDRQVTVSLTDGAKFRPGDAITIGTLGEGPTIVRISTTATSAVLQLNAPLANPYAIGAAVRLADTQPGSNVFRLSSTLPIAQGSLVNGAMLTITQGATSGTQLVGSVQTEQLGGGVVTYRVTLQQGLGFPIDMTTAATVQSDEFKMTVGQGAASQIYDHLALDPAHPRNYQAIINGDPTAVITVSPQEPPPPIPMPGNMPAPTGGAVALAGGSAEDLSTIADVDFTNALDTLQSLNDVNMIAVPDRRSATVQQAVIAQCELLADRFGVLDSEAGLDPFDPVAGLPFQRAGLDSARGYAALYYPWLRVPPAGSGDPILVPPSGHTCGIFARSDNSRGVAKAPANEIVSGALGLERVLSDIDQGILNPSGINAHRVFQTGGVPVLYGARTTATDANWQYVNIRRLFIFLEKSIQEGIRWAVFEPNNTALWAKLKRSIGNFLDQQWRAGALFGDKATDAYYVRIDDALNPFSEQALGRLNIEIGVRPSYPAEFIIVRIGIWAGGSVTSES